LKGANKGSRGSACAWLGLKPDAASLGFASQEIQGVFKTIISPEQVIFDYKRRGTENSHGFGLLRLPPQACLVVVAELGFEA